jgi:gas vesicle protein GvpA/GvpJ/GvpM family
MSTQKHAAGSGQGDQPPPELADVIDRVLDKGVVVDGYAPVSTVGIELGTVNQRWVIHGISHQDAPPDTSARRSSRKEDQGPRPDTRARASSRQRSRPPRKDKPV